MEPGDRRKPPLGSDRFNELVSCQFRLLQCRSTSPFASSGWLAVTRTRAEAIALVVGKQHQNGRWPLGDPHAGKVHFDMEGGRGTASRWNTLRALRVLDWFSAQG